MRTRSLPRRSTRIAIAAALVLFAEDADAQLEFAGTPWGAAREAATERIRSAGYTYRGVDQDGDPVFGAADSVDVVAMFGEGGLVHVEAVWQRDPDALPARYGRMADSMRAALGAPDTASVDEGEEFSERFVTWNRDGVTLQLYYRPRSGGLDTALILSHQGPGWEAEYERRDEMDRARTARERAEGTRDTTGVGDYHQAFGGFRVLIRVDTVQYQRLGPQSYRARFLHNWMQTRHLPNGLMYDASVTEVELDCRGVRTRLLRTIPLYDFRATPAVDVPEARRQWTAPAAGSPDEVAIRSACEVLARQP